MIAEDLARWAHDLAPTDDDPHISTVCVPATLAQRPPTPAEMERKVADCLVGTPLSADDVTWVAAPELLRSVLDPALD